jgi:hypothetical protein
MHGTCTKSETTPIDDQAMLDPKFHRLKICILQEAMPTLQMQFHHVLLKTSKQLLFLLNKVQAFQESLLDSQRGKIEKED